MNSLSIRCIKAAFICLALGIGLGAWFGIDRAQGAWLRPLHAALNLWGWTTLLIYGMAYHMLPRFAGRPLRRARLAAAQSWLAIAGVALVALGWVGVLGDLPLGQPALIAGAALIVAAAALFALLIGELLGREP
jgi:heme/copper-type cytochrome/quinol oxidase subunit 1